MNIPGDELYKLIKALSPSEKRYFKLFAKRQGDEGSKVYLKIFDLIDRQGEMYDEAAIRAALRKKEDIAVLPQMKIYLQDLILKSMRLYRSQKNVANELFDLIQDELFFTEKGLLDSRAKTLRRAKELAYKYDLMYMLMAVLQRERTFSILYSENDPMEAIENIHTEEKAALERLNNEAELGRIYYSLLAKFINSQLDHDAALSKEIEAYSSNPLMLDYSMLKTFQEKVYFLRAHTYICRFKNDLQGAIGYSRQVIALFEEYPQYTFHVAGNYLDALSNYLSLSHRAGSYAEFESIIEKMEVLPAEKRKDKVSITNKAMQFRILYILNTKHFDRITPLTEAFEKHLAANSKLIPVSTYITDNYNMAILYFMIEKMEQALMYCHRVVESSGDVRIELQHGADLLECILHFELNNTLYLESFLRNAQRSMQHAGTFGAFETIYFKFLRKLLKTAPAERKGVFAEMHTEFRKFKRHNRETKYVILLETLAWSLSRSDGSSLADNMFLDYD